MVQSNSIDTDIEGRGGHRTEVLVLTLRVEFKENVRSQTQLRDLESRLRETAKVNSCQPDQVFFFLFVYCSLMFQKYQWFLVSLSVRIVLDCFYLLIFHFEKASSLSFSVNVTLNLSNFYQPSGLHLGLA